MTPAIMIPGGAAPSTHGLSEQAAQSRLALDGPNELPKTQGRSTLTVVADVLREPMLLMLLGAGGIYLILGDLLEAAVLAGFAMTSIVITMAQEVRTERVLEALRDLTSPRALVVRDGRPRRIPGREVVVGDALILSEGDRVPADAVLTEGADVLADESLLTGESVPVRKVVCQGAFPLNLRPGGDDLALVFSGTLIVRGNGIAQVTATGLRSEIGKVSQALMSVPREPSPLQGQTRRLVRVFGVLGGALCLVVVGLYGMLRGNWLDAALAGLALSMSLVPEEFPVVLSVFLAMGAWRISKARVLTRRATAIETLGSTTVLCTDKTGTLTENVMSVREIRLRSGARTQETGEGSELDAEFAHVVATAARSCVVNSIDPMDKAIRDLDARGRNRADWTCVRTFGLRPDLLAVTRVFQGLEAGDPYVVTSKGAPEAIAQLCHLGDEDRARMDETIVAMATDGMRVLAVAEGVWAETGLPDAPQSCRLEFLGLIGIADPLRPSVPEAVAACRAAGVRVVMITGDHPSTARAIARQAGMDNADVITGNRLSELTEGELRACLKTAAIFSRVLPEHKLRIVNAYKANGEIVAMTGDGVNDAPSLRAAHIGVAMGGRGTDVAREAAAVVLLNDDFGSIVSAIRLGRRIYDNLEKVVAFIVAVHVPIAGLALLPIPLGLPLVLGPIHIALIEMVIDPVSTLVFESEPEEVDIMSRPPRNPRRVLFSYSLVLWGLLQGILSLVAIGAVAAIALKSGAAVPEVRAMTFVTLVLGTLGLVIVNRSFRASPVLAIARPNGPFMWIAAAVGGVLATALNWPAASHLLGFEPLDLRQLMTCFGAAMVATLTLEFCKLLKGRVTLARGEVGF